MARIKPVDLSSLSRPLAKREPVASQPGPAASRGWLTVAAWCVVGVMIFWALSGRESGPSPTPIDVDGLHVLVVEPDDRASVTKGQNEFINSVKVAEWVDGKSGQFRRYPESQNLDRVDPIWRELRSQADGTYRVIIAKDRKLTRMQLPDGIEAGIAALEGVR
jgi:hypothetical protein